MEPQAGNAYYLAVPSFSTQPSYLEPYLAASRKYGAGFGTLLWASPKTQATRFKALLQAVDINGLAVMDVGCGRADLLEHLFQHAQISAILYRD